MALPTLQEAAKLVFMDPYQVEQTETGINNLKRALTGRAPAFEGSTDDELWTQGDGTAPDPEALRRSLEGDLKLLKQHDPRPIANSLTPYEKSQLWKRIEARIERIRVGMPNDQQMRKAGAQEIDLHSRWQTVHEDDIFGLKTDLRLMDPSNDDPNFLNIDRFRPIEPCHVDWRTYYKNFDEISWQKGLEETLEPLDEDRFQRFCQYKAADWSAAMIQRDLGFTEAQYAQAMERLREIRDRMRPIEPEYERVPTSPAPPTVEMPQRDPSGPSTPQDIAALDWRFTIEDLWTYLQRHQITIAQVEKAAGMRVRALHDVKRGGRQLKAEERLKILEYLESLHTVGVGAGAKEADAWPQPTIQEASPAVEPPSEG